ncbi:hypothetical protein QK292_16020 [Arthrobacter sp. AL08]|uniref:hypothetical protein n=1 Tax=unclassified Arthrobacter TaxID=235627 RepID=UPI00249AC1A1|nr:MULTISPECIES: hypothetical protein [unclassified Arthrobacter]MDI3243064.1 hypothetical protein [Arthrobacter sp. AL05]MDI3279074.1 hypothetical protein [Arthrobacter sp. AL08]
MMMIFKVRPVRWTMNSPVEKALALILQASQTRGFTCRHNSSAVQINIPGSVLKRRKEERLAGTILPTAQGTEIFWGTPVPGSTTYEHLLAVESVLPEQVIDYQGLLEAAEKAGVVPSGVRALRHLVSFMKPGEGASAVGKGYVQDRPACVVLTDQRLLIVDLLDTPAAALADSPIKEIHKLVLGKKTSGETLSLYSGAGNVTIYGLGHGEGYGIVSRYRQAVQEIKGPALTRQSLETGPPSGEDE